MFRDDIYSYLRKIPKGKVVTYGDIAKALGQPKASRAVGNILHFNPDPVLNPCYKVVNAKGELAKNFGLKGGIETQKKKLLAEGIEVDNYKVDLTKYRWQQKRVR